MNSAIRTEGLSKSFGATFALRSAAAGAGTVAFNPRDPVGA